MQRILSIYRNAFSGLSPATWWLSLVMLINRSGTMVVPFMTLYLTKSQRFTIVQAGIVMSLFGLGAICGAFIGGKLTDKMGFYKVQLFALLLGGIMFLLLGQMRSYPLICLFSFLLSCFNDGFRPANSTAIAHYSKEENRTRSYSLNRLSINIGWAVGGSLGGFIASHNYHLLFWVDGLTNIGAALLLRIVLAPARNNATPHKHEKVIPDKQHSAYRDKPYMVFIFLCILFAYSFFQLFTTLPIFYSKELRMSETYIGIVMALNGILIAAFEMVIVSKLEGRRNMLSYVTIGTFLVALSFMTFNILPRGGMVAIIAMLLVTGGEMLSMPFMNTFWISRSQKNNRGQYAALYSISWSAAQVLGPGTGAEIVEKFGFTTLWWIIGTICLVTSAGYKLLQRRIA